MDVEKLITSVFMRVALWDQRNADHHNRYKLEHLWDEVTAEVGVPKKDVKNRWKSLRDKFRKVCIDMPKCKSGDEATKIHIGWPYYKSLLFLKDQFQPRASGGNFHIDGNSCDKEGARGELEEGNTDSAEACDEVTAGTATVTAGHREVAPDCDEPETVISTASPGSSTSFNSRKRKFHSQSVADSLLKLENQKLAYFKRRLNDDDDDLNFFKSFLPGLKGFTLSQKMDFRMDVMQLFQRHMQKNSSSE